MSNTIRLRKYRFIVIPVFYLIVMLSLSFIVSGFFSSKKTVFQKYDVPEGENRVVITYYYRGDKILKQRTELYNNYDETKLSVKAFKKTYKGLAFKYSKIKGVRASDNFKEKGVIIETIDVDYTTIANSDLKKYHGPIEKGELPERKPVKLRASESVLEKNGFVDSAKSFQSKEKQGD